MRAIVLAFAFALACASASAREIALTFDDAPIGDSALMTGAERAKKLITALKAAKVDQVAFFCVPNDLPPESAARLKAYAEAGHLIANHSNTHPSLNRTAADAYLADIATADKLLRTLPNFRPWFRFPFLHEGNTVEKRDAVRTGLRGMGYKQGYVTVDNYDFYINDLANKAKTENREVDQTALRDLYVETLVAAVEFYDAIAVKALGHSPRHVLLLHENDLAALFVGDLVTALRKDGWTIVSPTVAYEDPIASIEPDTLFLGQGRVAALAHMKGVPGGDLVHEREDDVVLDKLFAERVLKAPSN